MNWPLPEKYILMANKQTKIYSTWYVVKEMQIKMMNYHYPSIKMAKPQIMTTPKADKDVQQQELSFSAGKAKWYCHFGRKCVLTYLYHTIQPSSNHILVFIQMNEISC